ncbi:cytokine-inducible SH2-containing protein-like [Antedon mediterranea]|uniref:cytokine-inducible SH2-containing protein-like n=1 Tax=Antedon mediterranea TaxID=105859 RepID=UPI003AF49F11
MKQNCGLLTTSSTPTDIILKMTSCNRNTQLDVDSITRTNQILEESSWYHGSITYKQARQKLKDAKNGTFLVRDSLDPNYLYSVSVKTPRGATSVRIIYHRGKFALDCEDALKPYAPKFECVIKLLCHYISASTGKSKLHKDLKTSNNGQLVWLEPSGRKDTEAKLMRPLLTNVHSLQHLCRLAINKSCDRWDIMDLDLPLSLRYYVDRYPYKL